MKYWGWRPTIMLLCISVLVVACSDQPSDPPSQDTAQSPEITLIVRTPQENSPRSDPALPSVVTVLPNPTLLSTIQVPNPKVPTPLAMQVQAPTCYEALSGAILCLGTLTNTLDQPIVRPVVAVRLYDRQGDVLRERIVAADRRYVLPGESAPYRALFPSDDRRYLADDFGAAWAWLIRAERVNMRPDYATVPVSVTTESREAGQFTASLRVNNTGNHPLAAIRVGLILYDEQERVIGYRIVEGGPLATGDSKTLNISLLPQPVAGEWRYEVYAEGVLQTRP